MRLCPVPGHAPASLGANLHLATIWAAAAARVFLASTAVGSYGDEPAWAALLCCREVPAAMTAIQSERRWCH